MILKYLYRTTFILLWALMLSSCLGTSQTQVGEASHDAQAYAFSLTSSKDTTRALSGTKFTIDQVNSKIFNQDSLPYLFHVDSVKLTINGKGNYALAKVVLNLKDKDSTYVWNGKDSVAFKRLKSIETTAPDGKTVKLYDFSANIHRQDPYILHWEKIAQNYITAPISQQKTVSHNGKFITYYKTGTDLRASASSNTDGKTWTPVTVAGLPATVKMNTVIAISNGSTSTVYAQDADNSVYTSADGLVWSKLAPDYPVVAIYGKLPSTSGEFAILAAVKDGETLKFATTKDFATFELKNNLPESGKSGEKELPITGFSAVSLENPTVFSAKYIILSGGKDKNNIANNNIWILQEKDGQITDMSEVSSISLQLSQLFIYDNKVYLMNYEAGKNKLYYSENYGLNWVSGGTAQTFPENFTNRINASVITDKNNYIWIFGGESSAPAPIVDVWRGRLNKLAK